jgi:hypothetical protein
LFNAKIIVYLICFLCRREPRFPSDLLFCKVIVYLICCAKNNCIFDLFVQE